MTVKFAIRDDDPNYFTDPDELEEAYADLPPSIPISFSVVPFHGHTKSAAIPEEKWDDGSQEYAVGENEALVSYLQNGIESGRFSVTLHGYNHVYYPDGPEFVAGDNLHQRVNVGREYLEDILDTDIDVFVPPNNSFSKRGLDAVKKAGMKTFYYPTPLNRPKTPEVVKITLRDLWFKYQHLEGGPITFIQRANKFWRDNNHSVYMPVRPAQYTVRGESEITAMSLTSRHGPKRVKSIKKNMKLADQKNGVFCLAIHYTSFRDSDFKDQFNRLISFARTELEPHFVTVDSLFN